MELTVIEGKVN